MSGTGNSSMDYLAEEESAEEEPVGLDILARINIRSRLRKNDLLSNEEVEKLNSFDALWYVCEYVL